MKYLVVIFAVVAMTSGAALPASGSAEEFTGYREKDVIAADFEESVDEISKQYGQFVPGLGYVSYYSPLWSHIKDMSAEELNIFIEGLHALHQSENEEENVSSRRKDNAYGEHVEGLGFVSYHNPLWSIIKHFDSEELEAFVSQLHQHHHRPIPYTQEEESPNDHLNSEDVADIESSIEEKSIEDVLDVKEEASNGEEGKAQNDQADEENQEDISDEVQQDSDGAQEEGRDGEDEQVDEEISGENQEDVKAKADEDDDAATEELDDDVDARQNENGEDNDASGAEGDNDETDIQKQVKQ